jgi:hypothetical protein
MKRKGGKSNEYEHCFFHAGAVEPLLAAAMAA